MILERCSAEEAGISSSLIADEISRLDRADIHMHGFLVMRHGKLISETYWKPFGPETPHRMYSVTKSFVSIAVGALIGKGLLSLDDHIISYFPEYFPSEVSPYLKACTVRDMLMMASCHSRTAYKYGAVDNCIAHFSDNWVKSFFTAPPDHEPGVLFSYDTSSTQVLAALVEKLSGKSLLENLGDIFELEDGCRILKEPGGASAGGSGLVMTPRNLILCARKIMAMVKAADPYLSEAVSCRISTAVGSASGFPELSNGYGYQFWRISHNGYAMYGLGGQYVLMYPDYDMVFVSTADTQGIAQAEGQIFAAVHRILESSSDNPLPACDAAAARLASIENSLSLNAFTSEISGSIPDRLFTFADGRKIAIRIDGETGEFEYHNKDGVFIIPFGVCHNIITDIPMRASSPAAASAAFTSSSSIMIKVQFLGDELGSLSVDAAFKNGHLSVNMRLAGELSFTGFSALMTSL